MDLLFPSIIKNESAAAQTSFRFRNPEARQLHAWVNAEVEDMIDYAKPARELASDAIQGYMSVVARSRTSKKGSDITFPLLHSVIYSRQAIEAARAPRVKFKARTESDKQNMQWIESSINSSERGSYNSPPVDHTYFEWTFDKNLCGVGGMYVGFEFQTQTMHVMNPLTQKWEERKVVVSDDITETNMDFFNFGVSRDMKPGMYRGRAAYWDQFFDESSFFNKFGDNPFYENVQKGIIPDGDWFMGAASGVQKPQMWKRIYRVRHFWDIIHDLYYVQANGIPIRHAYIQDYGDWKDPKKMIPIATIHNDFSYEHSRQSALANFARQNNRFYDMSTSINTNKSFWSKSEALISKPMIAAKNTFGRSLVDYMKASGVHFVLGPSGVIERINKGKLSGIEPIALDQGDFTTKSLVQNSSFLNDFRVADDYFSKINTAALGRDIGRISNDNAPQATVAAMQKEGEEKRDAQNSRFNSTGGILRKYWLKYIMVKQYFPIPKKIEINDQGDMQDIDEYRVLRDEMGNPVMYMHAKKINIDFPVVERMYEKRTTKKDESGVDRNYLKREYKIMSPDHSEAAGLPAQTFITAREELFFTEEDPEIEMEPMSSFQENKALEKAVATEQLQALTPFFTMAYPDGKPVLPPEAINFILQHISRAFDIPFAEMMSFISGSQDKEQMDTLMPQGFASSQDLKPAARNPGAVNLTPPPPSGGGEIAASAGGPQFQGGAAQQMSPSGSPPAAGGALKGNAALAGM